MLFQSVCNSVRQYIVVYLCTGKVMVRLLLDLGQGRLVLDTLVLSLVLPFTLTQSQTRALPVAVCEFGVLVPTSTPLPTVAYLPTVPLLEEQFLFSKQKRE